MSICPCGNQLSGQRRKFCSDACKNKITVTDWRRNLKIRAIEYKGGKCERCGYSFCVAALTFHHMTGGKDFGISRSGQTRSWERVRTELDKCMLLCANCHAEVHDLQRKFSNTKS